MLLLFALLSSGCPRNRGLIMLRDADDPWMYGHEEDPLGTDAESTRFAVVGDMGLPGITQAVVAQGVVKACGGECDFVLLLGDNLYEEGVKDARDQARLACMVGRYPSEHKYLVLGNHDYIIDTPQIARARNELAWIRKDVADDGGVGARGRFHFYSFRAGPVRVLGIDTNFLVRGIIDESHLDLLKFMGRMRPGIDDWVIVFGHHPYVSNGAHGDAGSFREGGFRLWPGALFQHFMSQRVMGRADLYLAGHDHNLQFFSNPHGHGTAQLLSGSGAKCTGRGAYASDRAEMERYGFGFALVEAHRDRMVVSFHDYDGKRFWGAWRTRQDARWKPLDGVPQRSVDTRHRCADELRMMTSRTAVQTCLDLTR
jgi:hypothetical protein